MYHRIKYADYASIPEQAFLINSLVELSKTPAFDRPDVELWSESYYVKNFYLLFDAELMNWLDENHVDWHVQITAPEPVEQNINGCWLLSSETMNIGAEIVIPDIEQAVLYKTVWM